MKNHNREVSKFFNETDNYLHKTFGVRVRSKIVNELLGNISNKNILDVGCGNGLISLKYAKVNKLTLIDISDKMLGLAKANAQLMGIDSIDYHKGSIEDFDPSKKYDVIIVIGILSHLKSIRSTIVKLKKILSKDGDIIIQFSDYNSMITKMNIYLSKRKYAIKRLTKDKMLQIIDFCGFDLKSEIQYSILFPGMGRLPDKVLYHITMLTYQNSFLSKCGTEFIWHLKQK